LSFYQKIQCERSVFASRSHARALAAGLPRQDHDWIPTKQLVRFHKKSSMKCFCKLDVIENARSIKPNPTLP